MEGKYDGISMPVTNKRSDEEMGKLYFYQHKSAELLDNFNINDHIYF